MKFEEDWAEAIAIFLLAIGFITAVLLRSPYYSYLSVFFGGLISGRLYYIKRYTQPILPFILMIIGFLLGYIIGSFWVSRIWVIIFFAAGFYLSLYLHRKKILAIFKSELFLK